MKLHRVIVSTLGLVAVAGLIAGCGTTRHAAPSGGLCTPDKNGWVSTLCGSFSCPTDPVAAEAYNQTCAIGGPNGPTTTTTPPVYTPPVYTPPAPTYTAPAYVPPTYTPLPTYTPTPPITLPRQTITQCLDIGDSISCVTS